jgi:hypothetical protein
MILARAKELAQRGIKMTHRDFTDDEFITMLNIIVFDGVHVFFDMGKWKGLFIRWLGRVLILL